MSIQNNKNVAFDHGAAMRVPAGHDAKAHRALQLWLGDEGAHIAQAGAFQVWTAEGWAVAWPGDWIVLSVSGGFHVAHSPGRRADS